MMEKILQYINGNMDKALHISSGYILATIFPIAPAYGLAIALIAGKAKEMYDVKHQDKHTYDKWDMFATWLGGLVGFIVLVIK